MNSAEVVFQMCAVTSSIALLQRWKRNGGVRFVSEVLVDRKQVLQTSL